MSLKIHNVFILLEHGVGWREVIMGPNVLGNMAH